MVWARQALVIFGLVAALSAPGIAGVGARRAHPSTRRLVHVVQAGDTLWGIARSVSPGKDVVATVDLLIKENGLRTASIRPGQPLFLPAS